MRVVQALIDSPYEFRTERRRGYWRAIFEAADGTPVHVDLGDDGEVAFSRAGRQDLTGTGDAYRVLATVIAAIKAWLKSEQPPFFWFSGRRDHSGRLRVYDILAQRLSTQIPYDVQAGARKLPDKEGWNGQMLRDFKFYVFTHR